MADFSYTVQLMVLCWSLAWGQYKNRNCICSMFSFFHAVTPLGPFFWHLSLKWNDWSSAQPQTHWLSLKLVCLDLDWQDTPTTAHLLQTYHCQQNTGAYWRHAASNWLRNIASFWLHAHYSATHSIIATMRKLASTAAADVTLVQQSVTSFIMLV